MIDALELLSFLISCSVFFIGAVFFISLKNLLSSKFKKRDS